MTESTGVKRALVVRPPAWLASPGPGRKCLHFLKGQFVFRQGDEADKLYFVRVGRVRASVTSDNGKEATVAVFGPGDLIGLSCLVEGTARTVSVCALVTTEVTSMTKESFLEAIHQDNSFTDLVMNRIVRRLRQYEETLTHHITNNSERRLARALLHVSGFDTAGGDKMIEGVTQEMLAAMVGTTRPRVNGFMNKFRRMGYIEYEGSRIKVNGSLLKVIQ